MLHIWGSFKLYYDTEIKDSPIQMEEQPLNMVSIQKEMPGNALAGCWQSNNLEN